jgi:diaminohydroxyphosphoribosylaminopyrimidine deaminase/5-amino-6-(5-phosphoribosylamino)uracil reductase
VNPLERALELAERGRGTTHPNPIVGAVVALEDEVVGEGWHERAGGPHAEIVALEAAGERAHGGTLYTTLEPCVHHGRTGACVPAIVAAGIRRVVAAAVDPNPLVDGRGLDALRDAGLDVELANGALAARARRQNEAFRTWVRLGRPFVTYKAAMTLDGRLAAAGGESRWISGEESRRLVHELRAASDAVAVGAGTARADEPSLTARGVDAPRQPRRLVFGHDRGGGPSELEVLSGPLEEDLARLGEEGVQSLLLEGGPTIAGEFLRRGLIDKLVLFVAAKLVGGDDAPPLFAGPGARRLAEAIPLSGFETAWAGQDLVITAYVHEP